MFRKMRFILTLITLISILLVSCAYEQPAKQDNGKITEFNKLDEGEAEITDTPEDTTEQSISGLYAAERTGVNLYFLDEAAGQLSPETRKISGNESETELAFYILKELTEGPETSGLSPVMPENVKVNRVEIGENILAVDLSDEFHESKEPALARAALVNSLLDMGAFKYVKLYIDGQEATVSSDIDSGPLGLLTRYPVEVAEITALEEQNFNNKENRKVNWELFFRDNSGEFLLSEVRSITISEGKAAESIVNELIKGPITEGEGYYPVFPKGTTLQKTELIEGNSGRNGIALFFSKEFREKFTMNPSYEQSLIGSLIYSLTSLPDIHFVKIYYDNGYGFYIDDPVHGISLNRILTKRNYPDRMGKRIRIYFGSDQNLLVPEYRAISHDEKDVAYRILKELATNPVTPGAVRVLPANIPADDFKLEVKDELAVVDVPKEYFDEIRLDNNRVIRDLYALVNSLTDPINRTGITEVQFTVEGDVIESYMDISLKDSFVMNPALIKEN
ncbi:MAG: GerMN domain-containing protein [Clostridiales bacterium]|jgi:spore germination protein GerM|nr:GerMN domain-containing protein [Clostridiales bacterium]